MRLITLLCSLFLGLGSLAAHAAPFALTVGADGQFGTMNLGTGTYSSISTIPAGPLGIAIGPGGTLFEYDSAGNLNTVNRVTGATTLVGATGVTTSLFGGLGNGALYGLDFSNNLYRFSPTTGLATLIGATGITPLVPTYSNSLAGNGSSLFYTQSLNNGAGILYEINPDTAATVTIGSIGLTSVQGSGFIDSTLYGFNAFSAGLYAIDTTTAAATFVTNTAPAAGRVFGAVSAVPEPGSVSLLACALGIASVVMRKRGVHKAPGG